MQNLWPVVAAGVGTLAMVGMAFRPDDAVDVRLAPTAFRTVTSTVIATGQLRAKHRVDIDPEMPGRVVELPIHEGRRVRAGDVLFRLDATRNRASVQRAEAALAQAVNVVEQVRANHDLAATNYQRASEIARSSGLVALAELDQARTQVASLAAQLAGTQNGVEQARAALTEEREMLSKTTLTAPIGGMITRVRVRLGEVATSGGGNPNVGPAVTITGLDSVDAKVLLDETDLPRVRIGDSVTLRVDAWPTRRFAGRVSYVADAAGAGGGQQTAKFTADIVLRDVATELRSDLRPDLSVTAGIVTDRRDRALAVPLLAVVIRTPDGLLTDGASGANASSGTPRAGRVEGVFRVVAGVARFVPVRTGIVGDQNIEITAGLRPGDLVVAGPYQVLRGLQDGTPVRGHAPTAGAPSRE